MSNKESQTTIDEIHQIMFVLRGKDALIDGDYRSKHLGSILSILREEKQGNLKNTLSILTLRIGLGLRRLKEDYITGLINLGVITLENDCSTWHWRGLSAIIDKYGELKRPIENKTETFLQYAQKHPHQKQIEEQLKKEYTPDFIAYIKANEYENKTELELSEIIKKEKFNDTLKRCWLKELGITDYKKEEG